MQKTYEQIKNEVTALERIHTADYATYYNGSGERETSVLVCTHCEEEAEQYAALWPCETMQEAYYELDDIDAQEVKASQLQPFSHKG